VQDERLTLRERQCSNASWILRRQILPFKVAAVIRLNQRFACFAIVGGQMIQAHAFAPAALPPQIQGGIAHPRRSIQVLNELRPWKLGK